jgi:hypothetical protein
MSSCRECGTETGIFEWCNVNGCNKKWCILCAPGRCPDCGNSDFLTLYLVNGRSVSEEAYESYMSKS